MESPSRERRRRLGSGQYRAAISRCRACRINLLYDDLSRAELFRHEWEQVSGQAFDPWADIITVIGLLDGYRKHRPAERARYDIEEMLDRALTDLGR